MIVAKIGFDSGYEESAEWSLGGHPPFEVDRLNRAKTVILRADGDEYDYIFSSFRDMPIPYERVQIRGTITPRGKSVVFYGDMAKFILGNL